MKELDDLMEKFDKLYLPIRVKGKVYPANNPYLLDKINNLLHQRKITFSDIDVDFERIQLIHDRGSYIFYPQLQDFVNELLNEPGRVIPVEG